MSGQQRRRPILNVNAFGLGILPGAWQEPDVTRDSSVSHEHWRRVARTAERGLLDALFIADSPALMPPAFTASARLDPAVLLAFLATATEHLGFVTTESTTFETPHSLASRHSTLSSLTGGRFAWNVVTTFGDDVAGNFGADRLPPRAERAEGGLRVLDEVTSLWRRAGAPRPALFAAGGSQNTLRLAARYADALFTATSTFDVARAARTALRNAVSRAGRAPDAVAFLPGLEITIASTEAEAKERLHRLYDAAPDDYLLRFISGGTGLALDAYELDEPLPQEFFAEAERTSEQATGAIGFRNSWLGLARSHRGTLRDILRDSRESGGLHNVFVGVPEGLADHIERWFTAGAVDGFNLMPDALPGSLEVFVDEVVPILQSRGLHRREYGSDTLRERLLEGLVDTP